MPLVVDKAIHFNGPVFKGTPRKSGEGLVTNDPT